MKIATVPLNEAARLEALKSYQVLDSESESLYDDIALLASQICQTPVSLITLLDETRQWFKTHHGIPQTETVREQAFCSHAILDPEQVLIVKDSRLDERFADNPLVTGDPNVIFYAGAPLVTEDGFALGSLCVIDHTPREITSEQIQSLKILARQVIQLLELRKRNRQLSLANHTIRDNAEKNVQELMLKVDESSEQLHYANQELQQFGYIASHDLQEPLRKIQVFSSMLQDRFTLPEEALQYVNYINKSSDRLSSLISAILAYTKADAGLTEPVEFDSHILLDEVCSDFELLMTEKNATVHYADLPVLKGFKDPLRQIFFNLIANSLKFTEYEPVIYIEYQKILAAETNFKIKNPAPYYHSFTVRDNGIGFSPEFGGKIFQMFKRLETDGRFDGTGIGLSIVKRLVDAMHGQIKAEGRPGEGAIFRFEIPVLN